MFLFLSKLLPLLLYPIGMASVLLVLAFWHIKKRPKLARRLIILTMLVLWIPSTPAFSHWIARTLESRYRPQEIPQAQAIVVLGGATASQLPPRQWVEVLDSGDRLLYAAKLYREGKAPTVILSGGRIDWKGPGTAESTDMKTLIETMGVPATAMKEDPSSLNTRENAVNVKKILEQEKIDKFLLVTSATHMPRSMLIFQKLGMKPIAAPTDFSVSDREMAAATPQARLLDLLPEAEQLHRSSLAMKEYIGMVIYRLKGWI
jgi:uncharacterized SAM-binding protein YcdF (DUF218 family)